MNPLLSAGQDVLLIVGLLVRFLLGVLIFAVVLVPVAIAVAGFHELRQLLARGAGLDKAGHLTWWRAAAYAPWHTWLAPARDGLALIGLDALAERLLAEPAAVQVAKPGTKFHAGDAIASVMCAGRATPVRAPVDGFVIAINDDVIRSPRMLHRDPYHRGWLALISPSPVLPPSLRTGATAREWLASEERRLVQSVEQTLGVAMADGGELMRPAPHLLNDEQWGELVGKFL